MADSSDVEIQTISHRPIQSSTRAKRRNASTTLLQLSSPPDQRQKETLFLNSSPLPSPVKANKKGKARAVEIEEDVLELIESDDEGRVNGSDEDGDDDEVIIEAGQSAMTHDTGRSKSKHCTSSDDELPPPFYVASGPSQRTTSTGISPTNNAPAPRRLTVPSPASKRTLAGGTSSILLKLDNLLPDDLGVGPSTKKQKKRSRDHGLASSSSDEDTSLGRIKQKKSGGVDGNDGVGVGKAKTVKRKTPTPALSITEKEARTATKAQEKQAKAFEKARLAQEKAALVKANNLRVGNKATTVMELTIHVSGTAFDEDGSDEEPEDEIDGTGSKKKKRVKKSDRSQWKLITKQLQERMDPQGCAVERPEVPRRDLACEGALRWTRLCDRKWSQEKEIFEPLGEGNEIIVEEDSRLIFLSALDLSTHIANRTLTQHLEKVQKSVGDHVQVFLMHFGLNQLFRQMESAKQAAYREDTRARLANEQVDEPTIPKVVGIGENQPDKEAIQLELLRTQAQTRCFIIAVHTVEEAVDWIEQLTYDVSQKPYQRQRTMHIMALGTGEEKLSSGSDLKDTFVKMLASLKGVTEPVAKSIISHYPTIKELYLAWSRQPSTEAQKKLLMGISQGNLVTGVATNRAIGPSASDRIWRVFNSEDPTMFL